MRTTVDLDPGVLTRLKEEALRRRVPFKHLLNRLLREALEHKPAASPVRYRCPTFAMGIPAVDLGKALHVAASMEDEEVGVELERRK